MLSPEITYVPWTHTQCDQVLHNFLVQCAAELALTHVAVLAKFHGNFQAYLFLIANYLLTADHGVSYCIVSRRFLSV